jgi:hypothetical protein
VSALTAALLHCELEFCTFLSTATNLLPSPAGVNQAKVFAAWRYRLPEQPASR